MQYISSSVIFSVGRPYRKPLLTNPFLSVYLVICYLYFAKLILFPDDWSRNYFEIVTFQDPNFKYYIFIVSMVNFAFCYFIEITLIPIITRIYYRSKYFETLQKVQAKKYHPNLQELLDIRKEANRLEK